MTGAWACRSAGLLTLAIVVGGCVTPATGNTSYRGKARMSVESAISETQTARLTLQTLERDRIFTTTADETVTAAESALGSISAAFDSVQPPPESDPVHDRISKLLSDAEDAVTTSRIATRRNDQAGIRHALTDLFSVIRQLQRAKKQLS
jgi:hypothetical protein